MSPDTPYKVGNKKPPLHTRFPKGTSGNSSGRPKGRPKDLHNFGDILMEEFYKMVPASLGGKTVNVMQGKIVAMQMLKSAINKGPASMNLLLKFMEAHEARQARREELQAKKQADGSEEIDRTAEGEEVYQRLLAATADLVTAPNE